MSEFDNIPNALTPKNLRFPFSWVGHIPFIMWMMPRLKPKKFVELGTHSGNSYLAACQSIKQHELNTYCYAVDTWQGDVHAGQYDEDVYKVLCEDHHPNYASFSTLMRMTFDEASSQFEDKSIDLLHIDGLHTYDAVKHDFYTWLPKLSDNAVVLFHDTTVTDRNFGVYKFWDEIRIQYRYTLNFTHCNGLGVLFFNRPYNNDLLSFLDLDMNETWSNRFARLGDQVLFHACFNHVFSSEKNLSFEKKQLINLYDSLLHEYNLKVLELENTHTNKKNVFKKIKTKIRRITM